jgi:Tol biopolymer transport system component
MGKRAHPPSILAWLQRTSSQLASALRRLRPGPPAIALIATEVLAVLIVLAALLWPSGDGDQPAAVTQPSATVKATPYLTAAAPATQAETETPTPLDPARIFDNLPPPLVEERIPVSPFDSPRLDGGIYHLSIDGTELVRIANEVPVPGPYASFSRSTLSPDGRWLAFATETPIEGDSFVPASQVISLKDLAGTDPARAVAWFGRVTDLALSPDGRKLIAGGSVEPVYATTPGLNFHLLDLVERTVRALPQLDLAQGIRWSPTGEHIVFQKTVESSKSSLYIADGDGENVRELAPDAYGDAAWSPDGSAVAVTKCCDGAGIQLVKLDGQRRALEEARPHEGPFEPSTLVWSPDATRLAFHTLDSQGDGFFMAVADVQTGAVVIHGPGQNPVWQRDGSRLAFVRDGKIYLALPDARDQWAVISPEQPFVTSIAFSVNDSGILFNYQITPLRSLWRMSPSGEDQQFLAYGDSPVWSPDGSMIAFIGKVRVVTNDFGTGDLGQNEVWVMNADGSDPHKVGEYRWSASRLYGAAREGCARGLAWSADSTQVIFDGPSERSAAPADGSAPAVETGVGCGPGISPTGNGSITEPISGEPAIVYDAAGAEILRLPGRGTQWSPDGSLIAYWSGEATSQIDVVDYPSGASRITAPVAPMDDAFQPPQHTRRSSPELVWSPDSKRIAYEGSGGTYVLSVFDDQPSFDLGATGRPSWSPDGQSLAVIGGYESPPLHIFILAAQPYAPSGPRPLRITDGLTPSWSPDGSLILFTR